MVVNSPATGYRSAAHPAAGDGASPPTELASLISRQTADPQLARDLALAIKKPLEHSLEDLRFRPRRAAELIGPLLDAALVEHEERRLERLKESCWRCMAIAVNPSLWRLAINALWQGQPVWKHLEQRAGWYQVVEAVLIDSRTQVVLGTGSALGLRHNSTDQPLHSLLSSNTQAPAEQGALSGTDARDSQVLVLVSERCRLAVRVHGLPPETLRPQLQTVCLAADRLLDNVKVEPHARKMMFAQLVEKALLKNCPSASPWTRRTGVFFTIMALGLFAAACLSIGLEERRWQSVMQAFYDEPGFQVLSDNSAWGRHEIVGLRDPFARSPADVMRGKGMDPEKVTTRFKPFVSADELMTQLRQSASTRTLITIGGQVPVPTPATPLPSEIAPPPRS